MNWLIDTEFLSHSCTQICYLVKTLFQPSYSNITIYSILTMGNRMDTHSGAGYSYPSKAPAFNKVFDQGSCCAPEFNKDFDQGSGCPFFFPFFISFIFSLLMNYACPFLFFLFCRCFVFFYCCMSFNHVLMPPDFTQLSLCKEK